MTWIVLFSLFVISMIGAAAWVTIHSHADFRVRLASVLLFAGSIPGMLVAFSLIIGVPYPVFNVWPFTMPVGKNQVLGYKIVPSVGIYVLIDNGEASPPSFYGLPWDKQTAMDMNNQTEGELVLDVEGNGIGVFKSWDFSFITEKPKVTSNDMPDRPFEPKENPFETGPGMVLPPLN